MEKELKKELKVVQEQGDEFANIPEFEEELF
jgi:hypothetical protein